MQPVIASNEILTSKLCRLDCTAHSKWKEERNINTVFNCDRTTCYWHYILTNFPECLTDPSLSRKRSQKIEKASVYIGSIWILRYVICLHNWCTGWQFNHDCATFHFNERRCSNSDNFHGDESSCFKQEINSLSILGAIMEEVRSAFKSLTGTRTKMRLLGNPKRR